MSVPNILFIMFDQLRWDYLSCAGHPHLATPHIDRLAARGVRFSRAYVQSPLCGPSRMSTYTGRYVHSHGAFFNNVPLKVGERTMGDHLRDLGMECWLVGKTHMQADAAGMARLGLAPDSVIGARVAECGFDVFERDDGMRPEGPDGPYDEGGALRYNAYLADRGYGGDNPWHDHANSGVDDAGNVLSGWFLANSDRAANIRERDSETPYLTRRAMEFIEGRGDAPWCCHLSYIKPHWPYVVPAPYHAMFGPEHFLSPNRGKEERADPHPVYAAMMEAPVSRAFRRDDVRAKVMGAYMGLVKQCDDQLGMLFRWLEETGRMATTAIVVTSDHGDFLGDHWLGEKTFMQDAAVKVPLIVYDPNEAADATRGTVCDRLVETIDLAPTFVDLAGGDAAALDHVLEGRSLAPILRGEATATWRGHAFCEYDYCATPLAGKLGVSTRDARMFMAFDGRFKLVHFEGGFRPMLFDHETDPEERIDLGAAAEHAETRARLLDTLRDWALRPAQRTTRSNVEIVGGRGASARRGVLLGAVEEADVPDELSARYTGRKAPDMRER